MAGAYWSYGAKYIHPIWPNSGLKMTLVSSIFKHSLLLQRSFISRGLNNHLSLITYIPYKIRAVGNQRVP